MIRTILAVLISCLTMSFVLATELRRETPSETQAREIASKLRCPVCQGESVFDSHASIAREMKAIILEKVAAGETEAEIIAYFRNRYGDYVLMRPQLDRKHAFVWLAPFAIVVLAVLLACWRLRGRARQTVVTAQTADVDRILKELNEAGQ